MSTETLYVMVGYLLPAATQAVYWSVYNTPDMTGAYSGFPNQLTNIAISYQSELVAEPTNIPTGPASGDLANNYPNPIVVGLQGLPLSAVVPTTGQVLEWNGTTWVPSNNAAVCGAAGGVLAGTYPNPTLAITAPVQQVFNVKSYGAVGNGIADDATAITAAATAAAVNGGTVYFPQGTYNSSTEQDFTWNVSLKGDGWKISNIQFTGATNGFVCTGGATPGVYYGPGSRIEDIKITGNSISLDGLVLNNVEEARIEKIIVSNWGH